MQVSVSYRLSPHKYTNYPSMSLKLDYWSCNPLAFDREINVLLCKDASPEKWQVIQDLKEHKWSRSSNIFDKEQVSHILRLVLRSWGGGGGGGIGGVKKWKHFFFALAGCTKLQVDNLTSWLYKAYGHNLTFLSCFGLHEDWISGVLSSCWGHFLCKNWMTSFMVAYHSRVRGFLPILSPASTVLSTLSFKMWIYSSSHWNFH